MLITASGLWWYNYRGCWAPAPAIRAHTTQKRKSAFIEDKMFRNCTYLHLMWSHRHKPGILGLKRDSLLTNLDPSSSSWSEPIFRKIRQSATWGRRKMGSWPNFPVTRSSSEIWNLVHFSRVLSPRAPTSSSRAALPNPASFCCFVDLNHVWHPDRKRMA